MRARISTRIYTGVAGAAVLGIALVPLLFGRDADSQGAPTGSPTPVIVAEARAETLADRIEAIATTHGSESVEITSDVAEKIVEIRFDDGQIVAAGDVLVVLDKTEEEADLRAAQAGLEEARLNFARIEQLESRQVAAIAELDARRAALHAAEAQLAVIDARIAARVIRAPFDGVVGLRLVSLGALIQPGDVITTLDTLDPMRVDFTVPSVHLDTLRPGLAVESRADALAGRIFAGEIESVGTRVDPVSRSVSVRAAVDNPPPYALKPGLLMTVAIAQRPRRTAS